MRDRTLKLGRSPGLGVGRGLAAGLLACLTCLLLIGLGASPPRAEGAVVKEVVTISQDASTTESAFSLLGYDGTIESARLVIPTTTSTTHTLVVSSYNGSTIGEIEIASEQVTGGAGTSTISDLVYFPVAGDIRVRVRSTIAETAERTYYLLIFYRR